MSKIADLKNKEVHKKFILAREYLKDSQNALEYGGFRVATDAAYNAAELAMKIAILLKEHAIPRRHGGISQLFSSLYIKKGPLEKTMGRIISDGLEFRNNARYDENAEITQKHAKHNISWLKN